MITLCTGDMVDPATNTVIMRGNETSVRVQGVSGKISTVHFDQDDDDDDDDDDEQEDFGDDNEDVLSFEVESLQERNSAGRPAFLFVKGFIGRRRGEELLLWEGSEVGCILT